MKIKKLELIGFKSFVERTVLHFDHDVLAIVGPNGCGKSNIVDAIRWCLGEQSARHLRGRSMEDVIFNGSESRSPNDFAEVTLTFINDDPPEVSLGYDGRDLDGASPVPPGRGRDLDGASPVPPGRGRDLRSYAELAVTRRLHRTGESEYLINKTPVRLRDVTDLFLGTGAGTKAYSIVEQGKIGLIVSAKAEDRRLLIEEAAGITKFKSRKKQAEKKMDLTQQNLLRVGDIVAEIERNLVSLKRQAAKAERYVAYRNELEDLQLHEASHRYLELAGWIRLEGGEVERLSEESERARGDLTVREGELEAARLEMLRAEEKLSAAQNESFTAENAVRMEEGAIERAKDRMAALAHREQQAEGEKHEMREHASRLAAEREVVACEVALLSGDEEQQAERIAAEEELLAERAAAHAAADGQAAEARRCIAKTQAEIASAEAKLAGFERRQAEMTARRDKMRAERESLEWTRAEQAARAEQLRRSIDDLREGRETSAEEKARCERRLTGLKEVLQARERALDEAKGELSKKRSRHGALEEMHARLDGVGAGTKALMSARDAALAGLVADRVEAPAGLTQALAGLLGKRLQDVVVRDVGRGAELLADLATGRRGRATIVPLQAAFVAGVQARLPEDDGVVGRLADAVRFAAEDEALVRALVGDAVVVRDAAAARRLRGAGVRAALVALDGTVWHADGGISGGQGDEFAAGMLDGKREARELAEEIDRLDATVSARFAALQATRAELAQTGALLDKARHEAHARELALVTTEKDLQKAESQLEGVAKRLAALVAEDAELSRALDEAGVERDGAARGLEEARTRLEGLEGELQGLEAQLGEARERLEGQRQVLMACRVAIAGTREKLAAARGMESRLGRNASELEERARRLDEELVSNARSFGETGAQLVAHKEELHGALDRLRGLHDVLATARAEFESLRGGLLEREGALKEVRARVDQVREELAAHELALREKTLAMEHLLGGVSDKFRGLHLPRVVGDYHMRERPDEVSRSRIDELGRLIERMGSVNLDAMREHAEAEQRFTFYTTQKADLEKALADLTRAIQQMNRESRRLFQETFDAVNERFREIFPRMFRGGRAELRLTNPEDMLETGIDIVAQPPGKKLASIELMSGGEKALTAVSLIFAIFQITPSPFCILDEVDAPLDEANVARYNDMIRSMTERSQFILVTHVKRTMQLVDVLYGVTMPEAGVSKIVSVKINDTRGAERADEPAARAAVA